MQLQYTFSLYIYKSRIESFLDIFSDVNVIYHLLEKRKFYIGIDVEVKKFPLYVIVATHTVRRYRVLVVL